MGTKLIIARYVARFMAPGRSFAFSHWMKAGVVRTIWLAPLVGERAAELLETPVMITISFLAARFVVGKMKAPSLADRLKMGTLALLFLLGCETGVVVFVRQQSLGEYVASGDPVAGTVYLVALAVFAAAPSVWAGKLCIGSPMSRS